MELDLAKIKKIAEEKEDENWELRSFLKMVDELWHDGECHYC